MRGIDTKHEIDPTLLLRDTRTLGRRIGDFFSKPSNTSIVIFSLAAMGFIVPEVLLIVFMVAAVAFLYSYTRKQKLPFRLPKVAGVKDYNDLKPGIKTPNLCL